METTATCWRSTRTSHRSSFLSLWGRDAPFFLLWLTKLPSGHCRGVWHLGGRPWWRRGRHRGSDLPPISLLPSLIARTSFAVRRCILLLKTLQRSCWSPMNGHLVPLICPDGPRTSSRAIWILELWCVWFVWKVGGDYGVGLYVDHETALLVHDLWVIVARMCFAPLGGTFPLHDVIGFLHCVVDPQHFFDVVPPFVPKRLKSWLFVHLSCGQRCFLLRPWLLIFVVEDQVVTSTTRWNQLYLYRGRGGPR